MILFWHLETDTASNPVNQVSQLYPRVAEQDASIGVMRKSSLKVSPVGKCIRSMMQEFTMAIEVPLNSQSLWGLVGEVLRLFFQMNFRLIKQCEDPESIRVQI